VQQPAETSPTQHTSLHPSGPRKTTSRPILLTGLTMEDVEKAQVYFKKYDTNGDGHIDKEEFLIIVKDMMADRHLGNILLNRISEMEFKKADSDSSGDINEEEFLVVYNELILEHERRTAKK